MNCPKCGKKTKVLDSRHFDTPPKRSTGIDKYKEEVESKVGWYTNDWVYRRRRCSEKTCNAEFKTVELIIEDLNEMGKIYINENDNKL